MRSSKVHQQPDQNADNHESPGDRCTKAAQWGCWRRRCRRCPTSGPEGRAATAAFSVAGHGLPGTDPPPHVLASPAAFAAQSRHRPVAETSPLHDQSTAVGRVCIAAFLSMMSELHGHQEPVKDQKTNRSWRPKLGVLDRLLVLMSLGLAWKGRPRSAKGCSSMTLRA